MAKPEVGLGSFLPPSTVRDKESQTVKMAFEYMVCVEATNAHGLSGFLWYLTLTQEDWEDLVISYGSVRLRIRKEEAKKKREEKENSKDPPGLCDTLTDVLLPLLAFVAGTAWFFSIFAYLLNAVIITDQQATAFGGWCGLEELLPTQVRGWLGAECTLATNATNVTNTANTTRL